MSLKGKVALITGASTGIGAATSLLFAEKGASIIVNYRRNDEEAKRIVDRVKELGAEGLLAKCDVTSSREVDEMIKEGMESFGRIDILVNNAGGILQRQKLELMDERLWDETINLNLKGAFLCSRAVIPYMEGQKWGRIVNISSVAARMGGGEGAVPYAAAKAGLIGFTRALAKELAQSGITVNAVAPGLVDTPFHVKAKTDISKLIGRVPLGRMARPEEIASVIAFLASEEAGYITGEVIYVAGGFY